MNKFALNAFSHRQLEQSNIPVGTVVWAGLQAPRWKWHDRLLSDLDVQPGDRILAFGCGSGLGLSLCLAHGAAKVIGFDPSWVKLMIAYRRNRPAYFLGQLDLRHGGVEALRDSDTPADKVLCTNATEYLGDKAQTPQDFSSIVAPGGRIVIATRPLASTETATAVGEDFRLALIGAGWIGTRVEALPLGRGFSVCVSGRRPL